MRLFIFQGAEPKDIEVSKGKPTPRMLQRWRGNEGKLQVVSTNPTKPGAPKIKWPKPASQGPGKIQPRQAELF
jgi:hypothetical protein